MGIVIFIVITGLIIYFFLIRPQRARQQQQSQLMAGLSPGDEVLTAGGIYGRIRTVGDEDVTVEIASGTAVKLDKRAIANVITAEGEPTAAPAPAQPPGQAE